MTLRPAAATDLDALVRFEEEVFAEEPHRISRRQWRRMVADERGKAVVAEVDGALAGVLVLVQRGRHLRIQSLGVGRPWRGRGIARRLLEHAVAQACGTGLAEVRLEVRKENRRARRLYAAMGFTEVGRLADYYGLGEDGVRMVLRV